MSFTDEKPRIATNELINKYGGQSEKGKYFRCHLCGHKFIDGDYFRWVRVGNRFIVTCKLDDVSTIEGAWKQRLSQLEEIKQQFWWAFSQD